MRLRAVKHGYESVLRLGLAIALMMMQYD